MITYIGDLSRRDAELLRVLAEKSERILEFGAGASTQIFACSGRGMIDSVETADEWVHKTAAHIRALPVTRDVAFHRYAEFDFEHGACGSSYDLVFVDGVDELRLAFARQTWAPLLRVGGKMLFHDTRRRVPHGGSPLTDLQNVLEVVDQFAPEVDRVVLNQADSNITVVTKRFAPLLLEDWNAVEGRTPEQIGIA